MYAWFRTFNQMQVHEKKTITIITKKCALENSQRKMEAVSVWMVVSLNTLAVIQSSDKDDGFLGVFIHSQLLRWWLQRWSLGPYHSYIWYCPTPSSYWTGAEDVLQSTLLVKHWACWCCYNTCVQMWRVSHRTLPGWDISYGEAQLLRSLSNVSTVECGTALTRRGCRILGRMLLVDPSFEFQVGMTCPRLPACQLTWLHVGPSLGSWSRYCREYRQSEDWISSTWCSH